MSDECLLLRRGKSEHLDEWTADPNSTLLALDVIG